MIDVLVVGGGPAGLTAALAAARRGMRTRLVEASPGLGGMAAGTTIAGMAVDLGSHRLHPAASPRVRGLLHDLLGDELQVRPRNGRLRLRDRWVAFPFRTGDLVRTLPPSLVAAAGFDAVVAPLRRRGPDSYAEVVRRGLGPTALAEFHGPMAAKLWGVDPHRLGGELARRRIGVRTRGRLARTVLARDTADGRTFLYPRGGFGTIPARIAEAAVAAGATIDVATEVTGIVAGAGGTRVACAGAPPVDVGRVLWTAPLAPLAQALGRPDAPEPAHRGLVLAYLVVPARQWTSYDAHYVPHRDVAFSRISEPRNYRAAGADPDDRTVLCAELPVTEGDERWRADPAAIGALVVEGMARTGLPVPVVDHVELVRLPRVYPVLTAAAPGEREEALRWSSAVPGVTVLGRHGRVVADNVHHVLEMALSAVDCIGDDGRWDEAAWRRATAGFEHFVVQD